MNFLAHLVLAEPLPEPRLGNLIADFIKGRDLSRFSPGLRRGIMHHRQIDAFTDRHRVVFRSISRISENWGWFSGILVDVYYDHFLAIDFERYVPQTLNRFIEEIHSMLLGNWNLIPEEARFVMGKLIETNRLAQYATLDGIEDTLLRLSERIHERMPKREVHLEKSMPDFVRHFADLQRDFAEFFPELMTFAEIAWRTESTQSGTVSDVVSS